MRPRDGGTVALERAVADNLIKVAQSLRVSAEPLLTFSHHPMEKPHHAQT